MLRTLLRIKFDVRGMEHLPAPGSPGYIFIANHQSYLDIPLLIKTVGVFAFVSKDLIKWIPFVGMVAHGSGSIFFNRKKSDERKRVLSEIGEMAHQSTSICIFPEGTRSVDGKLGRKVQSGAIRYAHKLGLTIVPIAIDGMQYVLPKENNRLGFGKTVRISIGKAVRPDDYNKASDFFSTGWNAVKTMHAELQKESVTTRC